MQTYTQDIQNGRPLDNHHNKSVFLAHGKSRTRRRFHLRILCLHFSVYFQFALPMPIQCDLGQHRLPRAIVRLCSSQGQHCRHRLLLPLADCMSSRDFVGKGGAVRLFGLGLGYLQIRARFFLVFRALFSC